ncbi:DUF402 domain-containing protein [Rossellomorea aquimaris]|uniref:DUF402 domain-containing protein n=1 Tax=Rossellomorea aquimaris TaxID=189382 RepID=UPI0024955B24|nr:DUF402 domain-containing protein [Rossellomorea aquimaris]
MKRKYGDRSGWERIIERKYAQSFLDTVPFTGYITLLTAVKVKDPIIVDYGDHKVCILDDGYIWMHQFPMDKHHVVTTMFDDKGEIVQWYIDICYKNSIEKGIPYMEDLYLDIIVLPTGEVIEKDADELEDAYLSGVIDKHHYNLANSEYKRLINLISSGEFELMKLAEEHKELLMDK